MGLAIHSSVARSNPQRPPSKRIGDTIAGLGVRYAAEMNESGFAVALRARHLSHRSYIAFIATMYPLIVGFNRALIRSIAKVDHVRNASLVRVLARQLDEEQAHNQLWRAMLEVFDVDHETLYDEFDEFLSGFSAEQLDEHTRDVTLAVRHDLGAGAGTQFPGSLFPDAVIALYHHLWMSATDPDVSYWEHFAGQAGIEMVIYDVVTRSILPGVLGHPELDRGVASTRWLLEHGQPADPAARHAIDEEKHLALSRIALNRSETANALSHAVEQRAEDALRLFAASLIAQRPNDHSFPIERYLRG